MRQATSLRARAGDECGRGSHGVEVRLNPGGCVVFSGWAPGTPRKQRGTVAVPGTCVSPPAGSGGRPRGPERLLLGV